MVIYCGESVFGDQHVDFVVESIYLRHEFVQILNKLENDININNRYEQSVVSAPYGILHTRRNILFAFILLFHELYFDIQTADS